MTYLRTAAALSLILAFIALANDANAQASRQVTAIERRIQTMDQQSKQYEMENMGRDDKKPKVDAKRAREIKNEIAEDLNGLQATYNEIVLSLQENRIPADPTLFKQTAALGKMAERLKSNLALPKPVELREEDALDMASFDTRKKLLRALARHISDVITNPIFESTSGFNVDHGGRASKDLDRLIDFNTLINALVAE